MVKSQRQRRKSSTQHTHALALNGFEKEAQFQKRLLELAAEWGKREQERERKRERDSHHTLWGHVNTKIVCLYLARFYMTLRVFVANTTHTHTNRPQPK